MTAKEFEAEIQRLDKRFSIADNENRPGLSNIFFEGKNYDLPVISTDNIKDEIDPDYQYRFPNGIYGRFWAKPEIIDRLTGFLKKYNEGIYDGLID